MNYQQTKEAVSSAITEFAMQIVDSQEKEHLPFSGATASVTELTQKIMDITIPPADSPGPWGALHLGRGSFGDAVRAAKAGKKVMRIGWNGPGMFVVYSPGTKNLPADKFFAPALKEYVGRDGANSFMDVRPALMLKTAQEDVAYWSPSGSDALADDWQIID